MTSKTNAYENASTLGMSQIDLIIKVYDGAMNAFQDAAGFYKKGDNKAGFEKLEKAKTFVTHLYTTLDPGNGGEIAERLGKIYAYLINQTNIAQATKDLKIIDDNITVMGNLRKGWQGLKDQQKNVNEETAPAEKKSTTGMFTVSG